MATVIGVFRSREQAEAAVRAMRDDGFRDNEISIVAKRKGGEAAKRKDDTEQAAEPGGMDMGTGEDLSEGASWGGTLGGVAGLLAGVGALTIPGVGPIIAAGPLAAGLSGAVTGGITGGLLDLGLPEERGRHYEEEVKRGNILAVIETSAERIDKAAEILRSKGANDVESHKGKGKEK